MKRSLPVIDVPVNRRQFLLGAAAVGIAACSPARSDSNNTDTPSGDAGMTSEDAGPTDGGTMADAGIITGLSCPSDVFDTGQVPSAFVMGSPWGFDSATAYVVRDAGGLYALTWVCTHLQCTVNPQGGGFFCSCHNSTFDANGKRTSGPASAPLVHYALCIVDGNVGIDTGTIVPATDRLSA